MTGEDCYLHEEGYVFGLFVYQQDLFFIKLDRSVKQGQGKNSYNVPADLNPGADTLFFPYGNGLGGGLCSSALLVYIITNTVKIEK